MNPKQTDEPIEFHMSELLRAFPAFATDEDRNALIETVQAGFRQAREDAFTIVRDALREKGDDDRWTFVNYCLTGAIEHSGYGDWMMITKYDEGRTDFDIQHTPGLAGKERRPARAEIIEVGDDELDAAGVKKALKEGDEDHPAFTITHETIELGLQRIRHAMDVPDRGPHPEDRNLTSVKFLGRKQRNRIIAADLRNEAGQLDVLDYLAILEIALFNEIRYN